MIADVSIDVGVDEGEVAHEDGRTLAEAAGLAPGLQVTMTVGEALGLKAGDNPHQWYSPPALEKVIGRITADYEQAQINALKGGQMGRPDVFGALRAGRIGEGMAAAVAKVGDRLYLNDDGPSYATPIASASGARRTSSRRSTTRRSSATSPSGGRTCRCGSRGSPPCCSCSTRPRSSAT